MITSRFYALLLAALLLPGLQAMHAQACLQPGDVVLYDEGESGDLGGNVNSPPFEVTFPNPVVDGTSYVVIASAPDDERDAFRFTVPAGVMLTSFNIDEFTDCASISPRLKVWEGPDKNGTEIAVIPNYTGGNIIQLEAGEYTFLLDHDPTPDCSIGCYRVEFQFTTLEVETPDAPTIDIQEANACLGATGFGARVSVDDPGAGLEVYWRVLSAPAGVPFTTGDVLPPNANANQYRTDQQPRGQWFRLKQGANNVAPGTYVLEAFVKNAAGGESEAVGPFTIVADLLPEALVNYNGAPEGGCPSGATICSGETTDVSFNVSDADQMIVTAIRYDLESSAGGVCAQGAMDGYGPISGGTINLGDNVINGIVQTFVNTTEESVRIAYQVEPRSSTGSMCVGEAKWVGIVVEPAPSFTCINSTVTLQSNFALLTAADVVNFENYGNSLSCSYSLVSLSPAIVTCDDYDTTVPVEVVVTDGQGNTSSCTAMVYVDKSTDLPPGWDNEDINAANGDATYDYCEQAYTVTSSGYSLPTSDVQHVAYQYLCGDFDITAQVSSIDGSGFAGIIAREGSSPGAKKVAIKTQLSNFVRRDVRMSTNGYAQSQIMFSPGKSWLRLTRTGNMFQGFASSDGVNWQQILFVNVPFASCLKVGLFTEGIDNTQSTATFYNVSVNSAQPALSTPNIEQNIIENNVTLAPQFQVYPNPASTEVNIALQDYAGQNVEVLIQNSLGQIVRNRQIGEVQTQTESFSVNDLQKGLYLITVRTVDGGQATQKLLID